MSNELYSYQVSSLACTRALFASAGHSYLLIRNRHKTPTARYNKEQQANPKSRWYTRGLSNNLRQATQGKNRFKIVGKDEVVKGSHEAGFVGGRLPVQIWPRA